jgi:hypothetical protein
MKAGSALLLSLILLSGGVAAQEPRPAPTPATAAQAPAAESLAAKPKQLEGVTVFGSRFPVKECKPRDKACIALVVAELKQHYPEQLKRFCFQREMRAMRNATLFGPEEQGQGGGDYRTPAVLGTACASDKPK